MKPHAERHINESRLSVKYRIPPMSAGRILFPGSIPSYTNSRQSTRHVPFPPFFQRSRVPTFIQVLFQQFIHGFLIPYLGNEKIEQTGIADSEQRPCGTAPFVRILIRPVHPHLHIPDKAGTPPA